MSGDRHKRQMPVVDQPHAPIVYFEEAPAAAYMNGLVAVTLSARFHLPTAGPEVDEARFATAYLRTNLVGAQILRDALNRVLLLAQPVETEAKN